MDARELKIGNYVTIENDAWYDLKDVPLMVTMVKLEDDKMFPNSKSSVTACHLEDPKFDYSQFDEFIQPIKLTEEWITNFGLRLQSVSKHDFRYNKVLRTDKLYSTNPFNLDDTDTFEIEVIKDGDDNEIRRIGIKGIDHYDACNIQFVHELQNLYFALTKNELVLQERGEKV